MSSRVLTSSWFCTLCLLVLSAHAISAQTRKASSHSSSPLTQAKTQLAKRDLKSAEDTIWNVLSADPNNTDALLLLGDIRVEQKRYAEAETLFQRVVQLKPTSAVARLDLGKTYLTENKLPEATEQYKEAEQLSPGNIEVRATLASLYAANGDCSFAMSSLNAIPAAKFPAEAVPVKVGCLLALGHQNDALSEANTVKLPSLQLALAEVFVRAKLPQQALELLGKAASSGKTAPPRFYFIRGKAFDEAGEQAAALENFHKAITLDPNAEEFLLAAAELYARQNKHAEAFEILKRAYKVDPVSPNVLRPLIVEATFANKSADVQEAADRLAANAASPEDLLVAANVYVANTRQDEAVPLLEKYVQKVPGNPRAWVGLGLGYEDMKRFDDAQKAFESALKADPKFADAEYQLGLLMSLKGNNDAAGIEHFEKAVEINPNHAPALERLGNYYLEKGQFEKARDVLLKSEELDPKNRNVEYSLALAFAKLGKREEAKIHMEKFEKAGPIGSTETK